MPPLPRQGYENTGQDPANYTPEEKAAVAVVERWIETINARDTAGHMAIIDENITFRGDPTLPLGHGARTYCFTVVGLGGTPAGNLTSFTMSELFVIGGPGDTQVLLLHHDINGPANGTAGILGGYNVPVAAFLRVHNGKVVEWYDMPINRVSNGGMPPAIINAMPKPKPNPNGGSPLRDIPECMKYSNGST